MNPSIDQAVRGLREAFPEARLTVEEDGSGGAYVRLDNVELGPRFRPQHSWIAGHLPPQLPYADIYPLFVGADVSRVDGVPFSPPVTSGHCFRGCPALQVSRRTNRLDPTVQTAALKFQKVLHWLRTLP